VPVVPHQPGPWTWGISEQAPAKKGYPKPPPSLGRVASIQDGRGLTVVNCFGESGHANAELIVTAVNAYFAALSGTGDGRG
jgi:hypothetical protein